MEGFLFILQNIRKYVMIMQMGDCIPEQTDAVARKKQNEQEETLSN